MNTPMPERHRRDENWRTWHTADGKLKPGKGFAAEVRHLPRLAAAIAKAEAKARELGLVGDEGAGDE
jgi:hypothetical protein